MQPGVSLHGSCECDSSHVDASVIGRHVQPALGDLPFAVKFEITAQPPGKKLQNVNLLSGGEKTLTALALLFSGFLIKPTPLCILDEADAALDESNTSKFAELLRELSGEIQFIAVTHNKVTMESADYIYGVTMEEPGNSKVIAMELKEA